MTDTSSFSQATQIPAMGTDPSANSGFSQNPQATFTDLENSAQSATDKLAALLEEMRVNKIEAENTSADSVQAYAETKSIPQVSLAEMASFSNSAQIQPTIEQQFQSLDKSNSGYAGMMKNVGQKYTQSKPDLATLLNIFDRKSDSLELAETSAEPVQNSVSSIAQINTQAQENTHQDIGTIAAEKNDVSKLTLSLFMQKLSANLKKFGKLNIVDFNPAS